MLGETAERGLDLLLLDDLRCVETTGFRSVPGQARHVELAGGTAVDGGVATRAWALWSLPKAERNRIESSPLRGTWFKNRSEGFSALLPATA